MSLHMPPLNKFKITLTKTNTGEITEMMVQAPFELSDAKHIVKYMIDLSVYTITDIQQIQSVVKIPILPFCLS